MTTAVGGQASHYPYSAVCEVVATFKDGSKAVGSGCFVSANDVLTASHVLWDVDHGGAAVSVAVYPGVENGINGAHPFGVHYSAEIHYFQINDHNGQISHSDAQFDVGIISLATNDRLGAQTGTFGMDPNAHSGNYNLTGFPDPAGNGFDKMMNDFGSAKQNANYTTFDYESIFSYHGDSGGPLWYQGAAGPYVVGVCSTTDWAADIYKTYDQLQAWIHQDGVW